MAEVDDHFSENGKWIISCCSGEGNGKNHTDKQAKVIDDTISDDGPHQVG